MSQCDQVHRGNDLQCILSNDGHFWHAAAYVGANLEGTATLIVCAWRISETGMLEASYRSLNGFARNCGDLVPIPNRLVLELPPLIRPLVRAETLASQEEVPTHGVNDPHEREAMFDAANAWIRRLHRFGFPSCFLCDFIDGWISHTNHASLDDAQLVRGKDGEPFNSGHKARAEWKQVKP